MLRHVIWQKVPNVSEEATVLHVSSTCSETSVTWCYSPEDSSCRLVTSWLRHWSYWCVFAVWPGRTPAKYCLLKCNDTWSDRDFPTVDTDYPHSGSSWFSSVTPIKWWDIRPILNQTMTISFHVLCNLFFTELTTIQRYVYPETDKQTDTQTDRQHVDWQVGR
jgi:hypothetical protein